MYSKLVLSIIFFSTIILLLLYVVINNKEHYYNCNLLSASYLYNPSKCLNDSNTKTKLCDNKTYLDSDLHICNCNRITPIQSVSESNPENFILF